MANLATSQGDNTAIKSAGAVPILVRLLGSADTSTQVWALALHVQPPIQPASAHVSWRKLIILTVFQLVVTSFLSAIV